MFVEERLDLGINYGAIGGPSFSTTILVDGIGSEQRFINWSQPLGRWQIGDRLLSLSEWTYIRDFFFCRQGSLIGFRFKDWSDYKSINQFIGIGDGYTNQFQLLKTYGSGINTLYRPIKKPVLGTVHIYDNAIEVSDWSIDYSSGLITFFSTPYYSTITADFEFDVPVRFEADKLDARFDAYQDLDAFFSLNSLYVVETRVESYDAIVGQNCYYGS